ncbi:O-antigen ligase family protein [Amnibacterium endophyticum]|uniref:O-antigen ligase family protein n=1 Tax=Amnibacterium endophyticum TaxID=2109337 RepID=A0ABW4LFN2_9MICO
MRSERARDVFVFVALFSLWDGDGMRNALSWWGFGAVSLALLVVGVVVLRQERARLKPLLRSWSAAPILGFIAFCLLSTAWSEYRLATLLGWTIQAATATVAVALAVARPPGRLIAIGALMLHVHLALAIVFEVAVALSPAGEILPLWTDYGANVPGAYYWSQGLIFSGGRIQGIVGNANLTCFIAVLALILLATLWRAGRLRLRLVVAGAALDLVAIALSRSATALIALIAVAAAAVFVLGYRRAGPAVRGVLIGGGVLAIAVVALGSSRLAEPLLAVLGRGDDFTGRFEIWRLVGQLVADHPALGWGWIGYWAPWVYPFDNLVVRAGVQYLQAHNAYLDVLMQTGAVGLLLFAMVLGSLIWRALRLAVVPRPFSALPLLLVVALLTQALAESRLLIEGNWALLVTLSLLVPAASTSRDLSTAPEHGGVRDRALH